MWERYREAAEAASDINEHVPVLAAYASKCASVLELGVRSGVSSWAFLKGLAENGKPVKALLAVDTERSAAVDDIARAAAAHGIAYSFAQGDDLHVDCPRVDMTFIDTFHVYGQLKRELARFAPLTARYIVMHDTVVDAVAGEALRVGMDTAAAARATALPEHEIRRGLAPAIDEFLAANPEWVTEARFFNNNGLTVLARRGGMSGRGEPS